MESEARPFSKGEGFVEDLDIYGRGIVKDLGFPVFVPGAVLGQTIEYHLLEKRKKVWVGQLDRIVTESSSKVKNPCKFFPVCGGCDLLTTDYEKQLEWKSKKVLSDINRLGKIPWTTISEIIGMGEPVHYRNHMQFKVKDSLVGLYAKRTKDLVPITNCLVQNETGNLILERLQGAPELKDMEQIAFRVNHKNEVMIIFSMKKGKRPSSSLLALLMQPEVVSIFQGKTSKGKGHFQDRFQKIYGVETLEERLMDTDFQVSPGAFFQVNRTQAEVLYGLGLKYLELSKRDNVLDLYCGIGSITIPAGKLVRRVLGIEYNLSAVENARKNSEYNKSQNIQFAAGKVENMLDTLLKEDINYNKCILDPPRSGCEKSVIDTLIKQEFEKISYISCNPSTWARDAKLLVEGGYELEFVQPVDMFCNSLHIELASGFRRKN